MAMMRVTIFLTKLNLVFDAKFKRFHPARRFGRAVKNGGEAVALVFVYETR